MFLSYWRDGIHKSSMTPKPWRSINGTFYNKNFMKPISMKGKYWHSTSSHTLKEILCQQPSTSSIRSLKSQSPLFLRYWNLIWYEDVFIDPWWGQTNESAQKFDTQAEFIHTVWSRLDCRLQHTQQPQTETMSMCKRKQIKPDSFPCVWAYSLQLNCVFWSL